MEIIHGIFSEFEKLKTLNKVNIVSEDKPLVPVDSFKKNVSDETTDKTPVDIKNTINNKIIKDVDPGPVPSGLKVYTKGNPNWINTKTEYGLCLTGGGAENDGAMKWMINKSGGGDFVILRLHDVPDELTNRNSLTNYIYKLGGVDSVTTLIIDSKYKANLPYVEQVLKNADALWIAGGNQTTYYKYWKDSQLQKTINYLANNKKIPVGGTSAGMQALGSVIYTPEEGYDSVVSGDALNNPYLKPGSDPDGQTSGINLSQKLFDLPFMKNVILDTHFSERHRLGRTIVFLARMLKDGLTTSQYAKAIGNDESTSVVIDQNAKARVFGEYDLGFNDFAYFINPRTFPNNCNPDQKLDWNSPNGSIQVIKIPGTTDGRNAIDLNTWNTNDGEKIDINVFNGVLSDNIETPNKNNPIRK
jgi:cyanophycinase-like exopeptidase